MLKMRQGDYKKSFEICVEQIKDVKGERDHQFAMYIAEKGQKWHEKDGRIYYNYFRCLMNNSASITEEANNLKEHESPDQEAIEALEQKAALSKSQAIEVLTLNTKHLPYSKLTKNFSDDEELSTELLNMYTKTI